MNRGGLLGAVSVALYLLAFTHPATKALDVLAGQSQPASGQRRMEDDRQAIIKLEGDWLDHEYDRSTLERILADDFLHVVPVGVFLTKQQHIDWSVKHPREAGRRARFEKLDVRLYGNTAIARGIVRESDSEGKETGRSIFTDVFVYRGHEWQAVSAQENAVVAMH
jgi:hypothetical protein